jgi:hypothetical protein
VDGSGMLSTGTPVFASKTSSVALLRSTATRPGSGSTIASSMLVASVIAPVVGTSVNAS